MTTKDETIKELQARIEQLEAQINCLPVEVRRNRERMWEMMTRTLADVAAIKGSTPHVTTSGSPDKDAYLTDRSPNLLTQMPTFFVSGVGVTPSVLLSHSAWLWPAPGERTARDPEKAFTYWKKCTIQYLKDQIRRNNQETAALERALKGLKTND